MRSKIANEEIVLSKKAMKEASCPQDIWNYLENKFERITNKNNNNAEYEEKYSIVKIAQTKCIKNLSKKFKGTPNKQVIVEFRLFEEPKRGYIMTYNEFNESPIQIKCDIYI